MYRFKTIYTKDNIKILTRVQVHAYYWKSQLIMLISGIFLVGISVTCISSQRLAAFLTAAGCWLCISLTYPVQYLTKKIHKKMGENNRSFTYLFEQNAISIESGSNVNRISYDQIHNIVETRGEFCIFLTRYSGFLLSKAYLKEEYTADAFKSFIEGQTGLEIDNEQTLFLRIMKLRLIRK